jgi:uncharacterized protein (TIGR00369 family)
MNTPINNESNKEAALLQKLADSFTSIPFNNILGLQLDALSSEQVVMNFNMKEELIGNYMKNILHGGVISSVLDMAGGMVAMAQSIHIHQDQSIERLIEIVGHSGTVDLNINYLRPGRGPRFIAKAYLVRAGKHITFTRMELFNDDETLIATASGTYIIK